MPTYSVTRRFRADLERLDPAQRAKFRIAVEKFLADLPSGRFRNGLRVKGIRGADGIFEMTWDGDGRATFEFGPEQRPGEPHVIWRRIGTHAVLDEP